MGPALFQRAIARPRLSLLLIVGAGVLIRTVIAARTKGTNDVDTWLAFIDASRTHGVLHLYGVTEWPTVPVFEFNHGPLTALGIQFAVWILDATAIDARLLVRLPAIAADGFATVLAYLMITRRSGIPRGLGAAAMIAFNPVLILVSGFHGNTDTVFVALLLLSIVLLERDMGSAAGLALAASMAVKVVPVLAAPALLFSIGRPDVRRQFFLTTAITSAVLWLPPFLIDPGALIREVFLYRGLLGLWGTSRAALDLGWNVWASGFSQSLTLLTMFAILASSLYLARSGRDAIWSVAVAFLLFLAIAPGFGVQYLAWPVVFLVLAAPGFGAAYSAAAGGLLYATYVLWSGGGWKLGYANTWAEEKLQSTGVEDAKRLLWILVITLVYFMHRRVRQPAPEIEDAVQRPKVST